MNSKFLKLCVIALFVSIFSCNEKASKKTNTSEETTEKTTTVTKSVFKSVDQGKVDNLNKDIISKSIYADEDIMKHYAPKDDMAEGNYSYTISKKSISDNKVEVTLVENGRMDDSMAGLKVVMLIQKNENNSVVTSIKESYKCWKGRGHEDWGSEYCN